MSEGAPTEFEQQMIDAILRGIDYAAEHLGYVGERPGIVIALDKCVTADGHVFGAGCSQDVTPPVLMFGHRIVL